MSCEGHYGAAMPPRPNNLITPDNVCHVCFLPYGAPYVPPQSPTLPPNFHPGAAGGYVDGVMRSATGHIIGIAWGQLAGPNAHLARFKDVAIGPGHPLAEGMDPRSFIPCARSPSPLSMPKPPPSAVGPAPPPRAARAADALADGSVSTSQG